jgi:primary-amine oxidase
MSRNVSNVFHNVQNDYTDNIPDDDAQLHPAGRHVPQTSGEPSQGIPAWIESNPNADLTNTDVVLWHTFGITHFPSPEDFPVMPAEPMTLLLRPRNFFTRNPCLDIPPSYCSVPSGAKQGNTLVDKLSRLAFGEKKEEPTTCCSGEKFGAGV